MQGWQPRHYGPVGLQRRTGVITTEDDPTPLVLMLANTVRRSVAADPTAVGQLTGVAAVKSKNDPQAVTLRFDQGDVHLEHGVADDVDLTITLDLEMDGLPDAPKPKVAGAVRHPRFAMGLAKVLEPPMPDLRTALTDFWAAVGDKAGMPDSLRATDPGTGATVEVGEPGGHSYELLGPEDRLVRIFAGTAVALEEIESGRCHGRGSLPNALALMRAGLLLAIDDGTLTGGGDA